MLHYIVLLRYIYSPSFFNRSAQHRTLHSFPTRRSSDLDDGDQRRFGPLAALQQPFREIGARSELRDGDVDRADAGVQLAVPVAIALGEPAGRGLAPLSTNDGVRVGRQQGVDQDRKSVV